MINRNDPGEKRDILLKESSPDEEVVCIDLRRYRKEHGLTLEALAQKVNLTRGYLSLVERGLKVPSIFALVRLAGALNMTVSELIGGPAPEPRNYAITRHAQRAASGESESVGYQALVPSLTRKSMEPFLLRPRDVPTVSGGHDGEEFIVVLTGRVELILDEGITILDTGDCAYFDARMDHKLRNLGPEQSEVLVVIAQSRTDR